MVARMRYLIWTHPPVPGATAFYEDFAMMLRSPTARSNACTTAIGSACSRVRNGRRRSGVRALRAPREHADPWRQAVFIARKE